MSQIVAASPHVTTKNSTAVIMRDVLIALLPAVLAGCVVFGLRALLVVAVTTAAFQQGLPVPAKVSAFVLMMCLVFFAFTTILGWDYYSEKCLEYLVGGLSLIHI